MSQREELPDRIQWEGARDRTSRVSYEAGVVTELSPGPQSKVLLKMGPKEHINTSIESLTIKEAIIL